MNNKKFIMDRIENEEYYKSLSQFKVGDKIMIEKSIPSNYKGWDNSWVDDMDDALGREGIVCIMGNNRRGIIISFNDSRHGIYWYPPYSLKKI